MTGLTSVSYTHLDVYKRQVYAFEGENAEPARYELSLPAETEAENGVESSSSLDAIAIVSHDGGLCLLAAQTQQTIYEDCLLYTSIHENSIVSAPAAVKRRRKI